MHASIKRLQILSGLTSIRAIAKELGVAIGLMERWKTAGISKHAAKKAAVFYGVDIDYILTGQLPDVVEDTKTTKANLKTIKREKARVKLLAAQSRMHPSMKRLHEVTGLSRKKDICELLGLAASTVTNWGTRGVSKEVSLEIGTMYGINAAYILWGGDKAIITQKGTTAANTNASSSKHSHTHTPTQPSPTVATKDKKVVNTKDKKAVNTKDKKIVSEPVELIPVVISLSVNRAGELKLGEIKSMEIKPNGMSDNSLVFQVVGRSMLPEFNINDFAFVETEVKRGTLYDGDFVLVQHKDDEFADLKQVIFGLRNNEWYLASLNKDIPIYSTLRPFEDYALIGKVMSKVTKYKHPVRGYGRIPMTGFPVRN